MHYKETKGCCFQRENASSNSRESTIESWLSPYSEMDDEW